MCPQKVVLTEQHGNLVTNMATPRVTGCLIGVRVFATHAVWFSKYGYDLRFSKYGYDFKQNSIKRVRNCRKLKKFAYLSQKELKLRRR